MLGSGDEPDPNIYYRTKIILRQHPFIGPYFTAPACYSMGQFRSRHIPVELELPIQMAKCQLGNLIYS